MENRNINHIFKLKRGKLSELVPVIEGVIISQPLFKSSDTNNFQRFDVLVQTILHLYTKGLKVKNNIVILLPRKFETDRELYLVYTKNGNMYVSIEVPNFNKFFPNKVYNYTVHLGDGTKVAKATNEFNEVLTRLYLIQPKKVFDTNEV